MHITRQRGSKSAPFLLWKNRDGPLSQADPPISYNLLDLDGMALTAVRRPYFVGAPYRLSNFKILSIILGTVGH